MLIRGEWLPCTDGVTRPIIRADVVRPDGSRFLAPFLVDSGADRTVWSQDVLLLFDPTAVALPASQTLQGIGGQSGIVSVSGSVVFHRSDGGTARFDGNYAAFLSPDANDMSLLGRDIMDHFEVILSRRRNEVLLLAPAHQYHVSG